MPQRRIEALAELETNNELWEDIPAEKKEALLTWLIEGPGRPLFVAGKEDAKAREQYEDALFDESLWLAYGQAECSYCGNVIKHRRPPPAEDDLGWRRVAKEHTKKCVDTRAGALKPPKRAKGTPAAGVKVR